jgi:hypothetical protein
MSLTHSAFGKLRTVAVVFATVACGSAVPPPSTPTESQTANSAPDASSPGGSVASASASTADAKSASAETAVDVKKRLEFQFSPAGELALDGVRLSDKAGAGELTKRLGPATREKKRPSGEVSHYHDQQGLVFWTKDGELLGVGMNFNWDGDNKFPETSFTGNLTLRGLQVDRSTTMVQFKATKGDPVSCLGDSMCAGQSGGTKFVAGFEKDVITQVSFLFSKK